MTPSVSGNFVSATSGATISSVEELSGRGAKSGKSCRQENSAAPDEQAASRFSAIPCHTSLPHGLDEHGQTDGPDILTGELERIVAHAGSGLDALRHFRRSAHGQLHRCYPAPVTGTGSRIPSDAACKSSGRVVWCVLPLGRF